MKKKRRKDSDLNICPKCGGNKGNLGRKHKCSVHVMTEKEIQEFSRVFSFMGNKGKVTRKDVTKYD